MTASTDGARLLVLGAGLFQLAGITRARELGCSVFTADNVPDNPGHHLADESFDVSTTDVRRITALAADLDVDGIVTFASDIATPAVAATRASRGGTGPTPDVVAVTTDKSRFRAFQHRAGLAAPRCAAVTGERDQFAGWQLPLIVKPADSSGSRGVGLVESVEALPSAIESARTASPTSSVIVEEFVVGTEVGGDLFLAGGGLVHASITNKYLRQFVVHGHSLPSTIGSDLRRQVVNAVVETCRAVGIADGPVNFDVIVDPEHLAGPCVLEISPRTGGNGIPEVIRLSTGFDVHAATIRQALGDEVVPPTQLTARHCGSVVFGAPTSGRLVNVTCPDHLGGPDGVVHGFWRRQPDGSSVDRFIDAGSSLGYVVFDCRSEPDYQDVAGAIGRHLDIRVDEGV